MATALSPPPPDEKVNGKARALVLAGLWLLYGANTVEVLRGPPRLGDASAPVDVAHRPISLPGKGVLCAPLAAGQSLAVRCAKLGAKRRLLLGAGIDLPGASVSELEALPGIGPRLAQRIAAARPLPSVVDLARVRGIGPRRAAVLAPLLGLDDRQLPDICSVGLWPTTSSGCDKQR